MKDLRESFPNLVGYAEDRSTKGNDRLISSIMNDELTRSKRALEKSITEALRAEQRKPEKP